jgi:tetratricopeptide (TPR) repeat protein
MSLSATVIVLAVSAAVQVAPADRQRAELHYRAGWNALRAESYGESAKEFQAAVDAYPGFTLAYYGLGRADMGLKQYAAAIAAYEECRNLYLKAAGGVFRAQVDAIRARQDQQLELREAIRQTSQGPQTQRSQEMVRQFQNQLRLIQQNADRGLNMSLETAVPAFVSLALGSAYFRAERLADAEREYKSAIQVDPGAGEAHNNLAVVYLLTNRYAEAEKEAKAAEKAGYNVNPQLKEDIRKKKSEKQ